MKTKDQVTTMRIRSVDKKMLEALLPSLSTTKTISLLLDLLTSSAKSRAIIGSELSERFDLMNEALNREPEYCDSVDSPEG